MEHNQENNQKFSKIHDKMKSKPCNLLFITFDQLRGDWCNIDEPVIALPEIAKISKAGWSATKCYTSSPHCVPARFSWITGLAPSQLGVTSNRAIDIPYDSPSIIRDLKDEGYQTNVIGKTHWTRHDQPDDLRRKEEIIRAIGFEYIIEIAGPRALQRIKCSLTDEWEKANIKEEHIEDLKKRYMYGLNRRAWKVKKTVLPASLYPDCWITQKSIERIKELPENQPWILWVSYVGPHEPFDTPLPWSGKHNAVKFRKPIEAADWISRLPSTCELRRNKEKWSNKLSSQDVEACQRDYADHLRLLDDQVGALMEALNSRNDYDRTAIALTSDHGEMLGDAGMLYKGTFLESAINVPWIYKEPGDPNECKAQTYTKPVGLTELVKGTMSNLGSGGKVAQIQNICKHQRGKAIIEFKNERLFIRNNIKLCVDSEGKAQWAVDLKNDPAEQNNILERNILNPIIWLEIQWMKFWAFRMTKKRSRGRWMWRQL